MPYVPPEDRKRIEDLVCQLATEIANTSSKYGYKGAFAGDLNFAITRLIQILFRELTSTGESNSELRYWMQAVVYGILLDVVLEHKVRVNQSYEIAQMVKNGDCYDTPYYSKPIEVVNAKEEPIGYVYVNMVRTDETVYQNVIQEGKLMLCMRPPSVS